MTQFPCRAKAHWAHVSDAMRKAREYEMTHGYVFEWYLCECGEYHLRTKRHRGIKVLSLEALRKQQSRDG